MRDFRDTIVSDTRTFTEFDIDGNQSLDFEEFYAMQPNVIRDRYTAEEIRQWFDSADLDGNGVYVPHTHTRTRTRAREREREDSNSTVATSGLPAAS